MSRSDEKQSKEWWIGHMQAGKWWKRVLAGTYLVGNTFSWPEFEDPSLPEDGNDLSVVPRLHHASPSTTITSAATIGQQKGEKRAGPLPPRGFLVGNRHAATFGQNRGRSPGTPSVDRKEAIGGLGIFRKQPKIRRI
jgi:hypothetical protein